MAGNVIAVLAGAFLIAVALRDVFQAVIVPRAENTVLRISRYLLRGVWRVWPRLAYRLYADGQRREDFLATFAPFHLVTLLVVWVAILLVGWGLFFYGIRDELRPPHLNFGDTLYYAGSSLLTIGYGDIVAVAPFARITSLVAAASGLGTVAIVTSFLFLVFGAFGRREAFVVMLAARAGAPPSGVGLLVAHAHAAMRDELATLFRQGQLWTADVMESQLAYPILMMFRSSHDDQSWVGTLGTLLDAAALVMTTLDPPSGANTLAGAQARIMYAIGRHLTIDFAHAFFSSRPSSGPGVDRAEFDAACERLERAGYVLDDRDSSWRRFSTVRATYASQLNAMARWLEIPPIQWVGDRSPLDPPH